MFFYKIKAEFTDACRERLDAEIEHREDHAGRYYKNLFSRGFVLELWKETANFNDGLKEKVYFVSDIDEDGGVFGFVSGSEPFNSKEMAEYLERIGIESVKLEAREVSMGEIVHLLQQTQIRGRVNEQFYRMVPVENRFEYHEIMERVTDDEVLPFEWEEKGKSRDDKDRFVSRPLQEELERIRSMEALDEWFGHPVHYMIEADDKEFLDYASKTLMRELYRKGRIMSRKYMGLPVNRGRDFVLDIVYRCCEKGCLFLNIGTEEDDESPYACADMGDIILSAKWMKKYRNRTLTFFLLPRNCNKMKEILFEHTTGCTFVEITEDALGGEQAKNYLKIQAENSHVEADDCLYENLEAERDYLPPELNEQFERWLGGHLKHSIFPAYADLACVESKVIGKEAQGEAYDQLQRMIGLDDAKRVIDEALDYYKVQKLYKERGLMESRPVMHMVFAGRPGTAKTTVARLFAQIMKDNGLLSEGKLYEVGRADLVGQYVGWTAKQVKEAFKKAKGSVLFIDEAYSLVDDKKGMYGDEAINTIVQEMENNSKDMVVILAGYPDEMEELIERNPGLRSRIAFHVPFADYDEEELYGITKLIAEEKGLRLSSGVKKKLMPLFADARETEDFGNGRYVRNMVEKAQMRQASRLIRMDCEAVTDREIATLRAEDFEAVRLGRSTKRNAIGF